MKADEQMKVLNTHPLNPYIYLRSLHDHISDGLHSFSVAPSPAKNVLVKTCYRQTWSVEIIF